MTFLAKRYLTLLDNSHPFNFLVKPDWWKEDHFYNYHRSKGHNTNNYFKHKDAIQDLIDRGTVVMDGLVKKYDHKAFKMPLLEHEKGESS